MLLDRSKSSSVLLSDVDDELGVRLRDIAGKILQLGEEIHGVRQIVGFRRSGHVARDLCGTDAIVRLLDQLIGLGLVWIQFSGSIQCAQRSVIIFPVEQMPLPSAGSGRGLASRPALLDELAAIDVDAMTPLEALTKLYEVREKARGSSTDGPSPPPPLPEGEG